MSVCPNDAQDEIEKIMSEIENLQEVMNETAEAPTVESIEAQAEIEAPAEEAPEAEAPQEEVEPMAEFHESSAEAPLEETLGELRDEEPAPQGGMLASIEPEPISETESASEAEPVYEQPVRLAYERPRAAQPIQAQAAQDGGSLSLRLTGSMTLTLEYDYEGEQVTVGFADNMLRVQLSDGTEFKIPVRRDSKLRKAA